MALKMGILRFTGLRRVEEIVLNSISTLPRSQCKRENVVQYWNPKIGRCCYVDGQLKTLGTPD
jgi:hypothetical protein